MDPNGGMAPPETFGPSERHVSDTICDRGLPKTTRALAIRLLEQVAAVRKREKTGFVFFTLDLRAEGALPLVAKALKQGQ